MSFDVDPALRLSLNDHRQDRGEIDARHLDDPGAAEALATNAEVPFSMRLGAQERKLLTALARKSGKPLSRLARELLVDGLMRLDAEQRGAKPTVELGELQGLRESLHMLAMLAQNAEASFERIAQRQA